MTACGTYQTLMSTLNMSALRVKADVQICAGPTDLSDNPKVDILGFVCFVFLHCLSQRNIDQPNGIFLHPW
jgi:hypothetical protein